MPIIVRAGSIVSILQTNYHRGHIDKFVRLAICSTSSSGQHCPLPAVLQSGNKRIRAAVDSVKKFFFSNKKKLRICLNTKNHSEQTIKLFLKAFCLLFLASFIEAFYAIVS